MRSRIDCVLLDDASISPREPVRFAQREKIVEVLLPHARDEPPHRRVRPFIGDVEHVVLDERDDLLPEIAREAQPLENGVGDRARSAPHGDRTRCVRRRSASSPSCRDRAEGRSIADESSGPRQIAALEAVHEDVVRMILVLLLAVGRIRAREG